MCLCNMSGHQGVTLLCIIKTWSAVRTMQTRMEQDEGLHVEQTALLSPGRALFNREPLIVSSFQQRVSIFLLFSTENS